MCSNNCNQPAVYMVNHNNNNNIKTIINNFNNSNREIFIMWQHLMMIYLIWNDNILLLRSSLAQPYQPQQLKQPQQQLQFRWLSYVCHTNHVHPLRITQLPYRYSFLSLSSSSSLSDRLPVTTTTSRHRNHMTTFATANDQEYNWRELFSPIVFVSPWDIMTSISSSTSTILSYSLMPLHPSDQ
jgi:hypothetical protein